MRALSALELLDAWERGRLQPPAQRALILLAAACPQEPPDSLADLSIGQRDGRLLTLREWAFGSQLASLTACPECSERLEMTFGARDVRAESSASDPGAVQSLSVEGYDLCFRLPTTRDLATLPVGAAAETSRQALLERCLVSAEYEGAAVTASQLPDQVTEALLGQMAEADPQADVQLALTCPGCGHQWLAVFDILFFFWSEIDAWAYRMLHQVHVLASAYGWSEAEILSLSPGRRQFYLDLNGG